jgi:hypothetical protein
MPIQSLAHVRAQERPIPHGQLQVLDLEPLLAEATPGGQEFLAGAVEPIHLGPADGQYDDLWAESCPASW